MKSDLGETTYTLHMRNRKPWTVPSWTSDLEGRPRITQSDYSVSCPVDLSKGNKLEKPLFVIMIHHYLEGHGNLPVAVTADDVQPNLVEAMEIPGSLLIRSSKDLD